MPIRFPAQYIDIDGGVVMQTLQNPWGELRACTAAGIPLMHPGVEMLDEIPGRRVKNAAGGVGPGLHQLFEDEEA